MKFRKIAILALSLLATVAMSVAVVGCGGGKTEQSSQQQSSPQEQPALQEFTITFKQAGQTDVVKTVTEGGTLAEANVPTVASKTGYTVEWNETELNAALGAISSNLVVNAVETANKYTITYDANGGTASQPTQEVTYDSAFELAATATRADYDFTGWKKQDGTAVLNGIWKIADDVTLVASWTEKAKHTVTFIQNGQEDVVKTFTVGTALAKVDVPTVASKTGYTVEWNKTELDAALGATSGNLIVNAVETANTYTVTYDANDGTVSKTTQDVVYDSTVELATATRKGYTFVGWYKADDTPVENGVWEIADDVTLEAKWQAKTYKIVLKDGDKTEEKTVVFDKTFDFGTAPKKSGYTFKGWKLGSTTIQTTGTWTYDVEEGSVFVAVWEEDDEKNWTANY
ncbi:MAG: InlB B-repeat-containing protein [Clostridia bacterium]|nr:InlB B-repeat-containing protein [Clostridia bacterium]